MKFQIPTASLLITLLSTTTFVSAHDTCSGAYIDTLVPAPADCTHATRTFKNDTVTVDYKGSFTNGTIFDQSFDSPDGPLSFQYGIGQVIKGFDQGLKNMCVGERRWVMIPPKWGYGEKGVPGAIPPDSTLIFEILLRGINRTTKHHHYGPGYGKKDSLVLLE